MSSSYEMEYFGLFYWHLYTLWCGSPAIFSLLCFTCSCSSWFFFNAHFSYFSVEHSLPCIFSSCSFCMLLHIQIRNIILLNFFSPRLIIVCFHFLCTHFLFCSTWHALVSILVVSIDRQQFFLMFFMMLPLVLSYHVA